MPSESLPLRTTTIGAALARRKLTVAVVATLFLAGGAAAVALTPTAFEARAQLYVTPTQSSPGLDANPGLLDRYFAGQATTPRVLALAAGKLGRPLDSAFVDSVYAQPGQTNTVVVTVYDPDPRQAAAAANAVASSVVDAYRADQSARRDDARRYLQSQLAQLDPTGREYVDTYDRLQARDVALANSLDSVYVLAPAVPPTGPARPDRTRYLLVALLAGICAGLLAAVVRERLDERVRSAEELATAASARLVIGIENRAQASRRTSLLALAARRLDAPGKTLLVVGGGRGDDPGEVAEELGKAADAEGKRVVVFRDDLGLASPLVLGRLIAGGAERLTLVAVPAPSQSPTAISLASRADGAVIVATAGRTAFSAIAQTAGRLRDAGLPVVAAVLAPPRGRTLGETRR